MWSRATLVIVVTAATTDTSTNRVYAITAALLVAVVMFTTLAGARTRVVWFKICPAVLDTSATLLVALSLA
jgi:hypothetical protein